MNFSIVALAAFVPLIIGFIWYSPYVLGKAWMRASHLREGDLAKLNIVLVAVIVYVLSLMLAMVLSALVVHQYHLYSMLANEPAMKDPASPLSQTVKELMDQYGHNFRTFKHGVFHGVIAALFFALPVFGINAVLERKRFAYIAIHTGYWIITIGLMGGILCRFV